MIALFCVFGALTMAFILWECIIGIEALVPFSLATRTQVGASLEAVCLNFECMELSYTVY